MNLIQQLSTINPRWRTEIDPDPLIAAAELGLIEDDEGDMPEVDLNDSESLRAARDFYRDYMDSVEATDESEDAW